MAIRKVKPTSPGRRFQAYSSFEEVTKSTPEKQLLKAIKKTGGRNVYGRITCRHRGGGNKRRTISGFVSQMTVSIWAS